MTVVQLAITFVDIFHNRSRRTHLCVKNEKELSLFLLTMLIQATVSARSAYQGTKKIFLKFYQLIKELKKINISAV